MYITNNPSLAQYAVEAGVNRIFVDLEVLGKYERQGHKDTLISKHSIKDIAEIRKSLPHTDLLVRINPFNQDSQQEIEQVLEHKPQMIMLPMYKTSAEVDRVSSLINGRCDLIPLLETSEALECTEEVCQIKGVSELYVGLNDLHLSMNLKFMFQLLADGTVEKISKVVRSEGKKFGFGGIARLDEGSLPAQYILGEHVRLRSNSVILSRTFHRQFETVNELQNNVDFAEEIRKLRQYEHKVSCWNPEQLELNRQELVTIVNGLTKNV